MNRNARSSALVGRLPGECSLNLSRWPDPAFPLNTEPQASGDIRRRLLIDEA